MVTYFYDTGTSKSALSRGGSFQANLYCESTDTKPLTNIEINSLCVELDTGKLFYFNGTTWKEYGWNS